MCENHLPCYGFHAGRIIFGDLYMLGHGRAALDSAQREGNKKKGNKFAKTL